MHTDADGNITFYSSIGRVYYSILIGSLLFSAIFSACGIIYLSPIFFVIGVSSLFLFILFLYFTKKAIYVLEDGGIRFPRVFLVTWVGMPTFIPYAKIIKFYESREFPNLSLSLSLDQIFIDFRCADGKKDSISVSPKDKEIFASELTKRTGIPISANPHPGTR